MQRSCCLRLWLMTSNLINTGIQFSVCAFNPKVSGNIVVPSATDAKQTLKLHTSTHSACLLKDLFLKEVTYCASLLEKTVNELKFVAQSLLSYTTSVLSFAVCSIQSSQIILNKPLGGRRTHKEMAVERQKSLYLKDWAVIFAKEPKALWSTVCTQWLLEKSQEIRKGTHILHTKKLTSPQECHHSPLGAEENNGTLWHFSLKDTYRKVEVLRGRGKTQDSQWVHHYLPNEVFCYTSNPAILFKQTVSQACTETCWIHTGWD